MSVTEILSRACGISKDIKVTKYVNSLYVSVPEEFEFDRSAYACSIFHKVDAVQKPIIAFMGSFSSGKTFLVQYLLRTNLLKSSIDPETATITVLRHATDRPADWPKDKMVFALKDGANPTTLNFDHVAETGNYEDLKRLTTYSGDVNYDAVIVFIESEMLKDCIFLDCPGVGTFAEAEHEITERIRSKQKHSIRERELQSTAMQVADGFVVLSHLTGGGGAFSDSNTGQILAELTRHASRFPAVIPHGNLLLVGSQADPRKEGLRDESRVLSTVRAALVKQCDSLPDNMANKLNVQALTNRLVAFYAQDPSEVDEGELLLMRTLKRYDPLADPEKLRELAVTQYAEDRKNYERTNAFTAAFETMMLQMQMQMETYRKKFAIQELERSITHFSNKQASSLQKANAQSAIEALSRQYKDQKEERETVWQVLRAGPRTRLEQIKASVIDDVREVFIRFEGAPYVETFLSKEFSTKDQAKEHAGKRIEEELSKRFEKIMVTAIGDVEKGTLQDLRDFDERYLKQDAARLENIGLGDNADAALAIGSLKTTSATELFTTGLMGYVGGTTLLAVAGSSMAQAILTTALSLVVSGASTVGAGAAISGFLIGIPIYGWIALGVGALVWAVWRAMRSWQSVMAKSIAKSMSEKRHTTMTQVQDNITKVFKETVSILEASLNQTEALMNGQISEIHEIAEGLVTSDDLRSAAKFYGEHVDLLRETRELVGTE